MIDWGRVDELREEIGAEDFGEVVDLFLIEVEEVMDRLMAGPDLSKLRDEMHFLKGSSLNLGFRELARLCMEGERAAAKGEPEKVQVAAVIATFAASKTTFMERIEKLAAA